MSMCEKALVAGLSGIAITDHVNIGYGADRCREVTSGLKSDIKRAREAFGSLLEISMGIELGEGHHDLRLAEEIASDGDIDFIIGSLHRPRNSSDYYYLDYDKADLNAVFSVYYDELEEMAQAGFYDVIGHINYQLRYMSPAARERTDLSPHIGRLRGILREAARAGKGIEVNSSGLWQGAGFTLPSEEVVKFFREEGGEIVTTGSDAHKLAQIGAEIAGAVKCLKSAGFDKFAFFSKRTPIFHRV